MNHRLRNEADQIIRDAIKAVTPDAAVRKALEGREFQGRVYLVAVGKAAYQMAKVASELVTFASGIVVTKYKHVFGDIKNIECFEAGHPVPDENGINGAKAVWAMTSDLKSDDTVIFLLSGGGSALFEIPLIEMRELQEITDSLLRCGADINEINTIRKRLSAVKGGRFAEHIYPAKVLSIILSDIIGDPVDMIASGPTVADHSTSKDAKQIIEKYGISLSDTALSLIDKETPKDISNSEVVVIGSVKELCRAAERSACELGYQVTFLTDCLNCDARQAGHFLGNIARGNSNSKEKKAFVLGGEAVVRLKGNGVGGRNQEIVVEAAREIDGLENVAVFSVGSDGTDGPCDAAGGYVDGDTIQAISSVGLDLTKMQDDNDCYHILEAVDGLVITGPTGTNVNDFSMILIDENKL